MNILEKLYEYFPTAIYTGECLLIVSEVWKIEISRYEDMDYSSFGKSKERVKVQLFKRNEDNDFVPGAQQYFSISEISVLAEQVEKYITCTVAENIKEI